MKKFVFLFLLATLTGPIATFAEDLEADDKTEVTEAERPTWHSEIKSKYNLTDEQIEQAKKSGLNYPGIAKAAALSKASNKPLDEVIKMRTEQKMGWGEIAKASGVHPGELGKGVAELRHGIRDKRKEAKEERHEKRKEAKEEAKAKRKEAKEERKEKREERKEAREEKRAEKAEKKNGKH